jgi:hypothetical protein
MVTALDPMRLDFILTESDETEESEESCSGSLWFRDC